MPQAEGFGKNRRCRFDKLAEKPLCGCGGNPFGSDEPLPLSRRRAATQGKTLPVAVDVFLSCKLCGCVQGGNVAMSSSAARSADRGVPQAEGVNKNQHCSVKNFSAFNLAEKPLCG